MALPWRPQQLQRQNLQGHGRGADLLGPGAAGMPWSPLGPTRMGGCEFQGLRISNCVLQTKKLQFTIFRRTGGLRNCCRLVSWPLLFPPCHSMLL